MVWLGPQHRATLGRLALAIVSGLLLSWLGVAALITLSLAWPHNPVPRALLVVWAVLAAASFAIPGAFRGKTGGGPLVLLLAVPFMPFALAAIAVWPHLPDAVQDFLQGNFRSHRWARQQRKQAR
jgi:hypothetical protein